MMQLCYSALSKPNGFLKGARATIMVNSVLLLIFLPLVTAQQNGAVRLVDGPFPNCGRVEVFYDGKWGTICDQNWVDEDSIVVCKQLGYEGALQTPEDFDFGSSGGPVWIGEITCSQSSSSLIECSHQGWGVHNCSTREYDVTVCCDPRPPSLPVRLTCPKCTNSSICKTCPNKQHPHQSNCCEQPTVAGIVEVQVNGVWGPISVNGWGTNEATVVCGQLGYPISFPSGSQPPTIEDIWPEHSELTEVSSGMPESLNEDCYQSHYEDLKNLGQSFSYSFLQGLQCSGKESQLLNCSMSGVGPQPNPSHRVATVRCGFRPHYNCLPQQEQIYRMRAGAVQWLGRAEVRRNGEWGTICDNGFDELEGNIICRRLGYGTVKKIVRRAGYSRGVGKIHYTQIRCTGTEECIEDCESTRGYQAQECGHERDVGLECHVPDISQCSTEVLHNVIMKEESDGTTYPYVRGMLGWGIFCHHSDTPTVTREVGEVICRQSHREFLSIISHTSTKPASYSGGYYDGTIYCSGTESFLSECEVTVTPQILCPEGYTTVNCASALADLVPDVEKLKRSLEFDYAIQVHSMISLQCAYNEGCLSSTATWNGYPRKLLRFDSMTWNWGLADFKPTTSLREWEWHECHAHFHSMEEFAHYDLLYVNSRRRVAEGHKASFCLQDSRCARNYRRRFTCYAGKQGISPNCGDMYGRNLDCQWIDITGVRHNEYILQVSVNPNRIGLESDYENNQASCRIEIDDTYDWDMEEWVETVEVHECWQSDH